MYWEGHDDRVSVEGTIVNRDVFRHHEVTRYLE